MADPHPNLVFAARAPHIPTQLSAVPVPSDDALAARAAAVGVDVAGPLTYGPLVVDRARHVVTLDVRPLDLSARQVDLLAVFVGAPHRLWSRAQLHWVCWGDSGSSRTVGRHGVVRLRSKVGIALIRNVPDRGWILHTERRPIT